MWSEMEREPWKNMFLSEERRGEVLRKLYENLVLPGRLRKLLFDVCITRKHPSCDKLLEVLGFKTLFSLTGTVGRCRCSKAEKGNGCCSKRTLRKAMDRDE